VGTSICCPLLQSAAAAVHHPTKNVLGNAANLLANHGVQLFNILQSIRKHFFLLNIPIGKSLQLSDPVTGGHETSPKARDKAFWE
jgi:hypothetical protein